MVKNQQEQVIDQSLPKEQIFFNLTRKVGVMGRYQQLLFATLCLTAVLSGGVTLITPFLFYQNHYTCQQYSSSQECLNYVCSLPVNNRTDYIPQSGIVSLANKFGDYRCPEEQSELDLMKTFFYAGELFGFFFSSIVGDLIRIKILMLVGLFMTLIGILFLTLSPVLWLGVLGSFLTLAGMIIALNLTYVFVTELVEEKRRQAYKVILTALFSLGALFNVLWFFIAPNFQIVLLVFFGVPVLIVIIVFVVFIKDTPISLLTKNTPEKAYKNLLQIALFNGIEHPDLSVQQIRNLQEQYRRDYLSSNSKKVKKFTMLDLFRYKSLSLMTLYLLFLDCVFALQYLTPTLMLNRFNFSIYVNGLAIESGQIFAGLIPYFTIYKAPRRLEGMISFGVVLICSLVLTFVWDQNQTQSTDILTNVVVLIFMFLIVLTVSSAFNFYSVYLNELYPTQVRIIGIGFTKSWGSMTSMASAQIISACLSSGFKIMLLFAILASICIFLSYLLPETHGKRPPQVIEQLRIQKDEDEANHQYREFVQESG